MDGFINWIASYPKSGNTWVRALLCAYHYGEAFNLNNMDLIPGEPPRAIYNSLWPRDESWDLYDWACMRPIALMHAYSFRRHDKFFLKTHTANVKMYDMSLIPEKYTKRAIYVVRDPKDVLVSASKYFRNSLRKQWNLMKKDDNILGKENKGVWQPCSSYKMHVQSWLVSPNFPVLRIHYDSLKKDTETELVKILEFIETPIDNDRVKLAIELTKFDSLKKTESNSGFWENMPVSMRKDKQASQFFRSGKSNQWKEVLPEDLIKDIDKEYELIKDLISA